MIGTWPSSICTKKENIYQLYQIRSEEKIYIMGLINGDKIIKKRLNSTQGY